jgi:transcriptional regulator with XRE-family HTH domain
MSQHELAEATGMPQPSVARIERGTVSPRTSTLIELLHATGHRLALEPIGQPVPEDPIRQRLTLQITRRTHAALGAGDEIRILRRLRRFGVPFVLIGELAEVVHGSPAKIRRTIEVCAGTTAVARERLDMALEDLQAKPPNAAGLRRTVFGTLRIVTETAAGDPYDVLVRNAAARFVVPGLSVRVTALEDLIRDRRARHTPKDDDAARTLQAVLDATL